LCSQITGNGSLTLPIESVVFGVMLRRKKMRISQPIAHSSEKVDSKEHLECVHVLLSINI
jgi:hypothetical protein